MRVLVVVYDFLSEFEFCPVFDKNPLKMFEFCPAFDKNSLKMFEFSPAFDKKFALDVLIFID